MIVQKAYMIDVNPFNYGAVLHVLVDGNFVFIPSYGWCTLDHELYNLKVLPKKVEKPDWDGDQWWEKNWELSCWSWCYGQRKKAQFQPCHAIMEEDGSMAIFAV